MHWRKAEIQNRCRKSRCGPSNQPVAQEFRFGHGTLDGQLRVLFAMANDKPPVFNYVLSFILVGLAWGLTTPFIRQAARTHSPPPHPVLDSPRVKASWLRAKLYGAFFAAVDLLRNPRYAVPLLLNLTGSVWFFLLIGQAGESRLASQSSSFPSLMLPVHIPHPP